MAHRERKRADVNAPLKYQVIEFVCSDVDVKKEEVEEEKEGNDSDDIYESVKKFTSREAMIYAFGVTEQGESVCASLNGWEPFFFVKLKDGTQKHFKTTITAVEKLLSAYHRANFLVKRCHLVERIPFYGFQDGNKARFACLKFKTFTSCRNAFDTLNRTKKYEIYEGKIDQLYKFLHTRNYISWVSLPAGSFNNSNHATTQYDVELHMKDFTAIEESAIAPIRQCTVDIETFSQGSTESVLQQCNPWSRPDVVFQIASTFKTYGSKDFELKHIIVLGECNDWEEDNKVLVKCKTEGEMLMVWARLMYTMDPDIIYTWNGDWFDFDYLVKRAEMNGVCVQFLGLLSRIANKPAEMMCIHYRSRQQCSKCQPCSCKVVMERSLCKNCTKDDENAEKSSFLQSRPLRMYGRVNADMYPWMRSNTKHRILKLGVISDYYEVGQKNPITVNMIFESYREQDPEKVKEVARYCIQDTLLPQLIVDKLKYLPQLVELSRATYTPIQYILSRGQQARIISLLSRETRANGMLIPNINEDEDHTADPESDEEQELKRIKLESESTLTAIKSKKKYEGATVLAPTVGAYYKKIATLDFKSLYPSIMRCHNLCYSTIILDKAIASKIPAKDVFVMTWTNEDGDQFKHTFVKPHVCEGILPRILTRLAALRSQVKKDLAKEQKKVKADEMLCSILDAKQLAMKLIMNSIYGFLATPSLPCKAISATITAVGRNMIKRTSEHVRCKYEGSSVIYGDTDSVFVDFNKPLLNMHEFFIFCDKAAKDITKCLFQAPHDLEFEKVFDPLFLMAKKKYFGYKYTDPDREPKIENVGNVMRRDDVCAFVKNTYDKCQRILLNNRKSSGVEAVACLNEAILELKRTMKDDNNVVDFHQFAIAKTYKGKVYARPDSIPHVKVAKELTEKGYTVCAGDKIEYVYKSVRRRKANEPMDPKASKTENAMALIILLKERSRYTIDAQHYLALLQQPLLQTLSLVDASVKKIFDRAKIDIDLKNCNQPVITSYMEKVVERQGVKK